MELFNRIIIVHAGEVLLLEILMELFPHNLPFTNLLHLPKVLSPYGCPSNQIEGGYSSLHISWIVLHLEICSHPKKPSLSFLSILYLTIKGRRPFLLKFITWMVPVIPLPLIPMGWRAWIHSGSFRFRCLTRRSLSSSGTALTTFWSYGPVPRFHLPLDVSQNLQHGCIQPILVLLILNQSFIIFLVTLHLHP